MVLEAFCRFFQLPADFQITLPVPDQSLFDADEDIRTLQQYNPHRDCDSLRAQPALFEHLRGDYPYGENKISKFLFNFVCANLIKHLHEKY